MLYVPTRIFRLRKLWSLVLDLQRVLKCFTLFEGIFGSRLCKNTPEFDLNLPRFEYNYLLSRSDILHTVVLSLIFSDTVFHWSRYFWRDGGEWFDIQHRSFDTSAPSKTLCSSSFYSIFTCIRSSTGWFSLFRQLFFSKHAEATWTQLLVTWIRKLKSRIWIVKKCSFPSVLWGSDWKNTLIRSFLFWATPPYVTWLIARAKSCLDPDLSIFGVKHGHAHWQFMWNPKRGDVVDMCWER